MFGESELGAVIELIGNLVLEPRTAVLVLLLIVAAGSDVRSHRIPNWLVFGGTAFALLYNGLGFAVADNSMSVAFLRENGWLVSIEGLAVGLLALLPLYLLRAMGAGDVKLMAMAGAFLGPWNALLAVLATFLAGGLLALVYVVWTGTAGQALQNVFVVVRGNLLTAPAGVVDMQVPAGASAGKLPYGVAIATGTIAFLVSKQLGMIAW